MKHLDPNGITLIARPLAIVFLGASLAACASHGGRAEAVQAAAPSTTYKYQGDEGLVDATIKAEAYCRQYNAWPTTAEIRHGTDGSSHVTFVCDQTRAETLATARSLPPNTTVHYSYSDERALIDATAQAQRHCAGYGAEARSFTVTSERDGTRTVVFECIR